MGSRKDSRTRIGRSDVAYKLLLQKRLPSWLYFFEVGLTEQPESWDSVVPAREDSVYGGGYQIPRFNVFNTFACVPQWLYQHVGGIQPDPENPGFKHVIIKPQIGGGLSCAETSYKSINGEIRTHWWIKDVQPNGPNELHLQVTVPVNTTARVYIPGEEMALIKETKQTDIVAYLAQGVNLVGEDSESSTFIYEIESGEYEFVSVSSILFPFSCLNECGGCLDCESDDGEKPCYACNPDCNLQ